MSGSLSPDSRARAIVATTAFTITIVAAISAASGFIVGRSAGEQPSPVASVSSLPDRSSSTTGTSPNPPTTVVDVEPSTSTSAATSVVEVEVGDLLADPNRPDPFSIADSLSPDIVLPSDCALPVQDAASLPNSPRSYRSGIHQGIDFICLETGRQARAALDGRVVLLQTTYVEPDIDDRMLLLATAAEAGRTPFWTLAMLYGNHVVLDHGVVEGVGHVVTIYAHLETVDPSLVIGSPVAAGDLIGQIGNSGTSTAATGGDRPRSLHLHWELHVDDLFLGAGLDPASTQLLYERLFSVDLGS